MRCRRCLACVIFVSMTGFALFGVYGCALTPGELDLKQELHVRP